MGIVNPFHDGLLGFAQNCKLIQTFDCWDLLKHLILQVWPLTPNSLSLYLDVENNEGNSRETFY